MTKTIRKWAKDMETFHQKEHTDGKQAYAKIVIIISH